MSRGEHKGMVMLTQPEYFDVIAAFLVKYVIDKGVMGVDEVKASM